MNKPAPQDGGQKRSLLQSLELDTRLLGMIGAFVVICLVFNVITDGRFLTPRNIFNLSIQTVSVAIMATGMVFVIVTRHIDLSVGAVLAICSSVMGVMQVQLLPQFFGIGHPLVMPLTVIAGVLTGAAIGALNGWLVGYQRIPAFIVTLGGLLIWRNVGWYLTDGQTVGPLDQTFMLFGGVEGTVGSALSWALAVFFSVLAVLGLWRARQAKIRHEFPVKPLWAEGALMATAVAAILGFVAILNSYAIPVGRLKREFDSRGEVMPEGYVDYFGLPISVLILVVIVVVMTLIARKTRFGRYIFAAGGNPDAAELSGINTRMLTVKIFTLMGVLCAISAMVAQARLANHTNDIGSLDELRVIAAAVIGGTALAGGIGTIYGAVLGAVIMQSLQSGMAMVGVDAPFQNIVVGGVLVLAVWIDIQYRKRTGEKV